MYEAKSTTSQLHQHFHWLALIQGPFFSLSLSGCRHTQYRSDENPTHNKDKRSSPGLSKQNQECMDRTKAEGEDSCLHQRNPERNAESKNSSEVTVGQEMSPALVPDQVGEAAASSSADQLLSSSSPPPPPPPPPSTSSSTTPSSSPAVGRQLPSPLQVQHECFGLARGELFVDRYIDEEAKCIRCVDCGEFFHFTYFLQSVN